MSLNSLPLISIIIPTFNRAKLIGHTLDSVISQTYQEWECIVIDDGSTDQTMEVLSMYAKKDSRIRTTSRIDGIKGACTCRNMGIEEAKGEFILFLDSDDLLANYCLEKRIKEIVEINETYDLYIFQMAFFFDLHDDCFTLFNVKTNKSELFRFIEIDTVWGISQPLWKKESLKQIGGFKTDLPFMQDLDLNIKIFEQGLKFKWFHKLPPDCFARHHSDENRITSKSKKGSYETFGFYYERYKKLYESSEEKNAELLSSIKIYLGKIIRNLYKNHNPKVVKNFVKKSYQDDLISNWEYFIELLFINVLFLKHIKGFYLAKRLLNPGLNKFKSTWNKIKVENNYDN